LLVKFSEKPGDCGVVTARDIVFNVLAKGVNPMNVKISEIASSPIMCIEEDVDLYNAASMMVESDIARLFVCKDGKIIGVISLIDIMAGSLIMRARG
jgi:signal-transduction protein with cAMP-binding, CBS, and nucleotidyltransferase domain